MISRIIDIEARPEFKLWVRFEDGTEGEADLMDVAGRGVFKRWTDDPGEFFEVSIDPVSGAPTWPGGLDVAPDGIYQEVAGPAGRVTAE